MTSISLNSSLNPPLPPKSKETKKDLQWAIEHGTNAKVKKILKNNPELLDTPLSNGKLPLHHAIQRQKTEVVRHLIGMNADLEKLDDDGLNAFDHATIAQNKELKTFIFNNTILKNLLGRESLQRGFIFLTKEEEQLKEEERQERRAQANIRDPRMGITPLEFAVLTDDIPFMIRLLYYGADVNAKTHDGRSLLHLAAEKNLTNITQILLWTGLNPSEVDSEGNTPLSLMTANGNIRALSLLLAYDYFLKQKGPQTEEIVKKLTEVSQKHDPLHINNAEAWLFLTSIGYWLSHACISMDTTGYAQYLPMAMHLAGGAAITAKLLSSQQSLWKKTVKLATLAGIEMLPWLNVGMQMARTAYVAGSAILGLQAVAKHHAERPWQAFCKGAVQVVNTSQSLYMLKKLFVNEWTWSESIKEEVKSGGGNNFSPPPKNKSWWELFTTPVKCEYRDPEDYKKLSDIDKLKLDSLDPECQNHAEIIVGSMSKSEYRTLKAKVHSNTGNNSLFIKLIKAWDLVHPRKTDLENNQTDKTHFDQEKTEWDRITNKKILLLG